MTVTVVNRDGSAIRSGFASVNRNVLRIHHDPAG